MDVLDKINDTLTKTAEELKDEKEKKKAEEKDKEITLGLKDVIKSTSDAETIKNDDVPVIDIDWINSRFMTPDYKLDDDVAGYRMDSTSKGKYTDTSLGGNVGINSRPQFTRYCDIRNSISRNKTELTTHSRTGGHGMGRYYSEAIDDNAQTVFLEFGVPKFNSMLDFFMRAVDYEDSYVANHGRVPYGYKLGQVVGGIFMLAAFPIITLTVWAVKTASKLIFGHKNFDYYYMEPTMHTYWSSVNSIVTNMATELGILSPRFMGAGDPPYEEGKMGMPVKVDQDDLNALKELLPGLITSENYIDVYAIATRAQHLANVQRTLDRNLYTESEGSSGSDYAEFNPAAFRKKQSDSIVDKLDKYLTFSSYLDSTAKNDGLFAPKDKPSPMESNVVTEQVLNPETGKMETVSKGVVKNADGSYPIKETESEKSYLDKLANSLDSTLRGGGRYAAFYVNYTGSASESFSNSTGDIGLNEKMKSLSSAGRNVMFDMAGGNVASGVGEAVDTVKNVLAGALDSVSMGLSSVVSTITGGGYVDIPKRWMDSDMSLPTITYEMQLISPYGNTLSQLQNIYIPLAMILAGALPLQAGKASYTSPFLCSLYSKGIQNIKLGMITSLSISRGTSNLGFNKYRKPLAIDVSFTVTDFSQKMTAPIDNSLFDLFNIVPQDDTPLGNYIATLASRDYLTSKYTVPKAKLRASRMLMKKEQMFSGASMGMRMGESLDGILGGPLARHSLSLAHNN